MPKSRKTSEERVLAAVRGVAGQPATDELEAQWSEHAARRAPVVTLFGSYDSGKSTLLKRLLVDAGVTVPDWLTIAARRDTFEVNEVKAMGCWFRDTPGIASGSVEHERAAREALTTTDVILIVFPPQLITGDREAILAVVAGEIFRTGGIQLREALAFANVQDG
jgi:predicted GTPase